jgi:hypothetical protein
VIFYVELEDWSIGKKSYRIGDWLNEYATDEYYRSQAYSNCNWVWKEQLQRW